MHCKRTKLRTSKLNVTVSQESCLTAIRPLNDTSLSEDFLSSEVETLEEFIILEKPCKEIKDVSVVSYALWP